MSNPAENACMLVMELPTNLHAKLLQEATEKAIPIEEIIRMELKARYGEWGAYSPI